jgi:hypothetical protein
VQPRNSDRSLGVFGISKYLKHYFRRVSPNEAIGRHVLQNNRTSGNNCTLANCYSGKNQATDCNPASLADDNRRYLELKIFLSIIVAPGTQKGAPGDTNIRSDCDLREAENSNVVTDPGVIPKREPPRKGNIYVAAKAHTFPNSGTKGAEESAADT